MIRNIYIPFFLVLLSLYSQNSTLPNLENENFETSMNDSFEKIEEVENDESMIFYEHAINFLKSDDWENAKLFFQKSVDVGGLYSEKSIFELSVLFAKEGKIQQSLNLVNQLADFNLQNKSKFEIGRVYINKNLPQAKKIFLEILSINDPFWNPLCLWMLGEMAILENKNSLALDHLNLFYRKYKEHDLIEKVIFLLIQLYVKEGNSIKIQELTRFYNSTKIKNKLYSKEIQLLTK